MNLQTRRISLLDSSQTYCVTAYPQLKMLIWKFFKMVWTTHASAEASVPYWTIPPERFIGLHPRLTDLTPEMTQTLGRCKKVTTRNIMDTTDEVTTRNIMDTTKHIVSLGCHLLDLCPLFVWRNRCIKVCTVYCENPEHTQGGDPGCTYRQNDKIRNEYRYDGTDHQCEE